MKPGSESAIPLDPIEEAIFHVASELSDSKAREAFLERACGADGALRSRLVALLAAHEKAIQFFHGDPFGIDQKQQAVPPQGVSSSIEPGVEFIGRYKLLQKIGEGGMGVVYLAEQQEPVRRRVALKIIKLGMDTGAVVARFEAERQALAMMDHPNIAKVLDGGTTDTGRPYFVMELVRGIPITEYCDQAKLSTKERLDLFIKVCQAIQHAHQKGIIHRDIKPSNILVTLHDGVPVSRVIDFGIAKATQGELTDKTIHTQFQQFIGTPAYMSPEQAEMSGLDIDTRSDIYSLGVLLYELLVGSTPFDAKALVAQGIDAMRRTIREQEPPRPSTMLATLKPEELTTAAKRRSAATSKLLLQLNGDLDWIVMKCLEKDRTRRYETANGLAFDLKRHLSNEPVLARPPSATYRFQKAIRRNRLVFTAAGAITAALFLGSVVSTWQSVRATRAKREALAAQARETLQRTKAEANAQKALEAQRQETKLRQRAEAAELAARQRAYASDMNVVKQALASGNLGRAQDVVNRQRPQPGQQDLRGWEWRYLWQQIRSDASFTLCQKKSAIESLAVSADGHWLAMGMVYKDGLFVWDLHERKEVAHIAHVGPGDGQVRATFSPNGTLMVFTVVNLAPSGKEQNSLRLWSTVTRQIVAEIPLESECDGLAFSQDGHTLVTSTSGNLTLWLIPEGTKLHSYPTDHGSDYTSTSFAASSALGLAAYGTAGQVCIMDLHDGKKLLASPTPRQWVTALSFPPDGKMLASASGWGKSDIILWDPATGEETGRLEGHNSWVGALVFWPNGKKLASCSADQTIRIWDVPSRKCLDVLRGHRLEVWRLVLLPDNRTLVSGSKDGAVCVWDTSVTHPRPESITWQDKIDDWHFAPDSRSIVTLDYEGKVTRWSGPDFQSREDLLNITNYNGSDWTQPIANESCFSPDVHFLAVGSTNGNILVWDLSQRTLRLSFKAAEGRVAPQSFLSRGNRLLCWTSVGNHFSEWDLETAAEIQSWPAPVNARYLGVSPDDQLAVGLGRGGISGRSLTGQCNTNLALDAGDATEAAGAAFSSNGGQFAVASSSGFARVWNTATWQEEVTLAGFLNGVESVAFSPDGKRLAAGGFNPHDCVRLWDVGSWQEVLTLESTRLGFFKTAFSPDGNALGTLSMGGTLRVWQAPSWEEIKAAELKEKTLSNQKF